MLAQLDAPHAESSVYAESVYLAGWVCAPDARGRPVAVSAWIDDVLIGATSVFFGRPDLRDQLGPTSGAPLGFRLLGRLAGVEEPVDATIIVRGEWANHEPEELARCTVRLLPSGLERRPYGEAVRPNQDRVLHRDGIYSSGPPAEVASGEALQLIQQYLSPRSSIVDVGCGAGPYSAVLQQGYHWLGLEVNPTCVEILARKNLPHRKIMQPLSSLPAADAEFDHAICIEVLEHVAEPDSFLREIARVIRHRALFSVPNLEVLPYLSDWLVAPWHILEADHKNFFTRESLRSLLLRSFTAVEVFSYGQHPLRTREGVALDYHLFAVAQK